MENNELIERHSPHNSIRKLVYIDETFMVEQLKNSASPRKTREASVKFKVVLTWSFT